MSIKGVLLGAHTRPICLRDWIKTSDFLTTGVVLNEGYITRDINFALSLSNLLLLFSHWCWTVSATIVDDVLNIAKECRVAVKQNISIFGFIPFRIQQQVLVIEEPFNFPSMVVSSIWDSLQ